MRRKICNQSAYVRVILRDRLPGGYKKVVIIFFPKQRSFLSLRLAISFIRLIRPIVFSFRVQASILYHRLFVESHKSQQLWPSLQTPHSPPSLRHGITPHMLQFIQRALSYPPRASPFSSPAGALESEPPLQVALQQPVQVTLH